MINTIYLNARSINTLGLMDRLKNLKIFHMIFMIMILEHMIDNSNLDICKIYLTIEYVACNGNGKILLLWNHEADCTTLDHDAEQVTCQIKHMDHPSSYLNTFIYVM